MTGIRALVLAASLCFVLAWQQVGSQPFKGERIPFSTTVPDSALYSGGVGIKLKYGTKVDWQMNPFGKWNTGLSMLDVVLNKFEVKQVSELFEPVISSAIAGENSHALKQMEAFGIDRWFCLRFPETISPKLLCQALQGIAYVEEATPFGKIQRQGVPSDDRFAQQWHLQNTGQTGGLAGADVKAVPAWDINTGSPEVIVSVHDGGILATHPDLQQNMWFGTGFNFVTNTPIQQPDNHGTHVAGLVAAVRNNGAGISGMAGGNGSTSSGVRLMSLQIIGGTPVLPAHEAQSFIYAANNGAAISQNSWSYQASDFFPAYMADAIDYFVASGGGNVLKGGLVVFSAGNYNGETKYYPAPYSKVLAVGATNHTDVRAAYSSYGSWVDLVAPGGESGAPILSTVLNNGYSTLFGTSMSCPLVSGTAALLASHLPGRLLADDVRSLLLYGVDDIYPINAVNMQGKLGAGRLNAYKALQRADSMKQLPLLAPVRNASVKLLCNEIELNWDVPQPGRQVLIAYAPSDQRIGQPFGVSLSVGNALPYGGIVVYKGTGANVRLPMPVDGTSGYFRIWINDGSLYNYSIGTDLGFEVPYTASAVQSIGKESAILISWQRQCPNRGLLLAYSTDARFGVPAGNPANVQQINGGGTALQYGEQTSFEHTGLQPDRTYFYALYPYQQIGSDWLYGAPKVLSASTLCKTGALPIIENFAGNDFPAANWRIVDGGPGGSLVPDNRTWRRVALAGNTPDDNSAALINAYTQNGSNSKELLRTPAFVMPAMADSLMVSFDYAYRAYSDEADLADSLELVWTADCGSTVNSIWKAGGVGLATVPGFSTAEFVPADASQWKSRRFDLLKILPTGTSNIAVGFLATNKFGQNIWLDNVAIRSYTAIRSDVAVTSWTAPMNPVICKGAITPKVMLVNRGADTLKSVRLVWTIDGQVADSLIITGLRLPRDKDTLLTLKPLSLNEGPHRISVLGKLPNGLEDENKLNDTLRTEFAVAGVANDPHVQGFENASQLAGGWATAPAYSAWNVSNGAAFAGSNSLWVNRFADTVLNGALELFSPVTSLKSGADSLFLQFSLAAAHRNPAGPVKSDTLEIWVTNDCGAARQLVYRKAGAKLATNAGATDAPFVPAKNDWRQDTVNLTSLLSQFQSGIQAIFRLVRGGGNNLYLDDIRLFTKTIPIALRQAGYGVYPNPFISSFTIWHLQPQPGWRSARLMDATGRVVKLWQWNGNAPQTLTVQAANLPAGLYLLHVQYDGYSRTQKLMKR